jgi:hypothetical protein
MITEWHIYFHFYRETHNHWDYVFLPEIAYMANDYVIPIETLSESESVYKPSLSFEVSSYVSIFFSSRFCFL